jgi:hypothetical protein
MSKERNNMFKILMKIGGLLSECVCVCVCVCVLELRTCVLSQHPLLSCRHVMRDTHRQTVLAFLTCWGNSHHHVPTYLLPTTIAHGEKLCKCKVKPRTYYTYTICSWQEIVCVKKCKVKDKGEGGHYQNKGLALPCPILVVLFFHPCALSSVRSNLMFYIYIFIYI